MPVATSYQAVYLLYTDFLHWVQGTLNSLAYRVNCPEAKVVLKSDGTCVFSTPVPIHCIDWPFRSGGRKRTLDILLSIEEDINLESGNYIRVRIRLNYLKKEEAGVKAIESLRYDCEIPAPSQHPIYHAHTSDEVLTLPESLTSQVDSSPIAARHDRFRIPSAFVNLPAILAIIFSDHLDRVHWYEIMPPLVERCQRFPTLPEPTLITKLREQRTPGAWLWYELMVAEQDSRTVPTSGDDEPLR